VNGKLYLAAALAGAANTANAYRPFARTGPVAAASFAAGTITDEAPLQSIAWQVGASGLFAARGALGSRSGKVGLAISVASWAALANLYVQARRTDAIVDAALRDGLGDDYRQRAGRGPDRVDAPLTVRQIALPTMGRRRQYTRGRNISYGEFGRRNQLDVWHRPGGSVRSPAPVILQVHGGGWTIGRKEGQGEPLLTELVEQGWVGVAINYRLSPRSQWPDHIADVKRAIAWIKANIHEYGGDPSFVAITGGSAGGHLTALAALTPNDPAFQPGFEDADTTVQAAVPFYGVYDVADLADQGPNDIVALWESKIIGGSLTDQRDRFVQASPQARATAAAPPFMVLHGTNDTLVPVDQARRFVARLRAVSEQSVVYVELPLAQHAFDVFTSVRTIHVVRGVARFLTIAHAEAAAAGAAGQGRKDPAPAP
jgi:acetyl esterase/lipase